MFLCKGREGKDKVKEGGWEEWQLRDVSRVNGDENPRYHHLCPPDITDPCRVAMQKQHLRLAFESGQWRGRSLNNIII